MTTFLEHVTGLAAKAAQEPKVAGAVGTATAAVGSFWDYMPDALLAKIATLSGICLTLLLILIHGIKLYRMIKYGDQG